MAAASDASALGAADADAAADAADAADAAAAGGQTAAAAAAAATAAAAGGGGAGQPHDLVLPMHTPSYDGCVAAKPGTRGVSSSAAGEPHDALPAVPSAKLFWAQTIKAHSAKLAPLWQQLPPEKLAVLQAHMA